MDRPVAAAEIAQWRSSPGERYRRMQITEERSEGAAVVVFAGRLETQASKAAEQCLMKLLDAGEIYIVLDLAALEYVSSIGLRALMTTARRAEASGARIVVCALPPAITQIFEIAGFTSLFATFDTRGEALRARGEGR